MKFIHAADIHLDSPLRGLDRYEGAPVEEVRSATRHAFNNLVELAVDEAVDFVLLAGDLYDGDWKDYNTGLYFVAKMQRLEAAGILVFVIAGNHDAASQITKKLRLPDNVSLFNTNKPQTVINEELNLAVHGQGFAKREVTEDLSLSYPQADPHRFNIGLLHTCLDGKPGHEPYAPCKVSGLQSKGYQYWALGHVHSREIVSNEPWIVFPGNIQGRHIRETGPKGCTLVEVLGGEVARVEHRDLDVLRWEVCKVDISQCGNCDEAYQAVKDGLQHISNGAQGRLCATRLILYGTSSLHSELQSAKEQWVQEYRALANGLGGAGVWLEKVLLNTQPLLSGDELQIREDALGGLRLAIESIRNDPDGIDVLIDEVTTLRQKLPAELLGAAEPFDPSNRDYLVASLTEVEELLMSRLMRGSGS